MTKQIQTPLLPNTAKTLRAGDSVEISGVIYTARDAAHKKIVEMMKNGENPPFPFENQIVYYAGPSPAPQGKIIGSIGPTTSGRMDAYSPFLITRGLLYMLGKGIRNEETVDAIVKFGGVYFSAVGGAAALMAARVSSCEVIAFPEFGAEAVRKLTVKNFPAIVAIDSGGRTVFNY
ncbi:fumarate hydratase [Clostridia bacterium]|nr:fumarate hydratase [Clostridia bacterium]